MAAARFPASVRSGRRFICVFRSACAGAGFVSCAAGKEIGLSTPYCAADSLRGCDRSFAHSAREQTDALPARSACLHRPVRRLRIWPAAPRLTVPGTVFAAFLQPKMQKV